MVTVGRGRPFLSGDSYARSAPDSQLRGGTGMGEVPAGLALPSAALQVSAWPASPSHESSMASELQLTARNSRLPPQLRLATRMRESVGEGQAIRCSARTTSGLAPSSDGGRPNPRSPAIRIASARY